MTEALTTNSSPPLRWRLILGKDAERADVRLALNADGAGGDDLQQRQELDEALEFVYAPRVTGSGRADLSAPTAYIPRWLDLIRTAFSADTVTLLIRDALEKRGLTQLLLEPETLKSLDPDPRVVASLLALKDHVPPAAREAIREIVRRLVQKLQERIQHRVVSAVRQGIRRRTRLHGSYRSMDWPRTVTRNLRHYDTVRRQIIPERFYFRGGDEAAGDWQVILLVDQSGSMAESVIHAVIAGAALASVHAIRSHMLLFGSEVVDMTDQMTDPVDLLMGAQIGGGTDIDRAVEYASRLAQNPARSLIVLISDLYEGGDADSLVARLAALNDSRCRTACIPAINAEGRADYDEAMASRIAAIGTPSFVASPDDLAPLLASLWAPVWPP